MKALFETATENRLNKDKINTDTLTVSREESTTETDQTRKKIDLVVRTTSHLIGIENKIHAELNNPFEVYSEHLDNEAKKATLIPIKIILSLKHSQKVIENFVQIQYSTFFTKLIGKLTEKEVPANPTKSQAAYNWYLYDFIASILNLDRKIEHDWPALKAMKEDMDKIISRGGKFIKGMS